MGPDDRLTLEEAAAYLRKSTSWLYRNRVREGIRAYRVGGCWQFFRSDLDSYIDSKADGARAVVQSSDRSLNKVVLVSSKR